MPCLEMKVALARLPQPATSLRQLLERPGAAILRRNNITDAPGHEDAALHGHVRVIAVLAVDLTNPPREPEPPPAAQDSTNPADAGETTPESPESDSPSFAKGLEVWLFDGTRSVCVHVDADEIAGALAMFDAYLRLARYQPAFQRLDQRIVGLSYLFREGLTLAIQGDPGTSAHPADTSLESTSAIPEIDDFRQTAFSTRLSDPGVGYFHELLRAASAWLDENSYPNILGSK